MESRMARNFPRIVAGVPPFDQIVAFQRIRPQVKQLRDLSIVINELHVNPNVKGEPVEYVELFNAGSTEIDISGWTISDDRP